jgi:hypothetical protein
MVRAALDLVSEPGDPVLMWTSYPWPYLNLRRVPATRYIWKNFLLGEIYLARSGPQYVLPGTWETFVADVRRTDPAGFVVEAVNPLVPGTPFERVVEDRFTTMFGDEVATLGLRKDLAAWLRTPPASGGSPSPDDTVELEPDASVRLEDAGCVRFDGEIVSAPDEEARVSFTFGSPSSTGTAVTPSLTFARTGEASASVTSRGSVGNPFAVQVDVSLSEATPFTLVVGSRAAVLVIGGAVAGAVEADGGGPVTVAAASTGTRLEQLRRAAAGPTAVGC